MSNLRFIYVVESIVFLLWCKFLIMVCPYRWYRDSFGYLHSETLYENVGMDLKTVKLIQCTIESVVKYIPFSRCLDQAMTAQRMLLRRNHSTTIYFGMLKQKNNRWIGHAWVRCGDVWVVGFHENICYGISGMCALVA